MSHLTIGRLLLAAILTYGLLPEGREETEPRLYRLFQGSFSPQAERFLISVEAHPSDPDSEPFLVVYSRREESVKHISSAGAPTGVAWVPGQPAFVATYFHKMTLFRDASSAHGYAQMPIQTPAEVFYAQCSWNPAGQKLAVYCIDFRQHDRALYRLGLYDAKEDKFVLTDIEISPDAWYLCWKNDSTLYVRGTSGILEVHMESGPPKVMQTIPMSRRGLFLAIIEGKVLVLSDEGLELGNRKLVERNMAGGMSPRSVIATRTTIFVSIDSTYLAAFDSEGQEIAKFNPGKTVSFGTVGEDNNAVYGIAGDMLVRLSLKNGSLTMQEVYDLTEGTVAFHRKNNASDE